MDDETIFLIQSCMAIQAVEFIGELDKKRNSKFATIVTTAVKVAHMKMITCIGPPAANEYALTIIAASPQSEDGITGWRALDRIQFDKGIELELKNRYKQLTGDEALITAAGMFSGSYDLLQGLYGTNQAKRLVGEIIGCKVETIQ